MSKHHADLVAAIEAFAAEAGMSEITFGRKAVSDPHFVRDIRGSRRLWPETESKVRHFMATYRPTAKGSVAA